MKLLYLPRLKPFLSGPDWNIGDLKDSENKNQYDNIKYRAKNYVLIGMTTSPQP